MIAMSKPTDKTAPEAKKLDRRSFVMMGGAGAAAAAVVPIVGEAEAAPENATERTKARYKETEHVKTFYRVNRY